MTNYYILLTKKWQHGLVFLVLNCIHNYYNFTFSSFASLLFSAFLAFSKALKNEGTRLTPTKMFRLCLSESSHNFIITRDHVNFSSKKYQGRSPHDEEKI